MRKSTKIIGTLSDKRCQKEFIQSLYEAGMDAVRINTAHQVPETAIKIIDAVRETNPAIPIILDTKGPEVRTSGKGEVLEVKEGDTVLVKSDPTGETKGNTLCISYENIVRDTEVGQAILIDDGEVCLKVVKLHSTHLECRVENDGKIAKRKSVNLPGLILHLPSVSEKDREFIRFADEQKCEFVAHSFVRSERDIYEVQAVLDEINSPMKIIAKIENLEGVKNIDEILNSCYGIMVARGDLGIEVEPERLPVIQRELVRKAIQHKKVVIIATQMLHSMIEHPRPTRAEVSDVANAIYYMADAIMLSGETAYGKYAIEAVELMSKIAKEVESSHDRSNPSMPASTQTENKEIPVYLAKAAVMAATELSPRAIITESGSGRSPRYLAAYRGNIPIFAMCFNERVRNELSLNYGMTPFVINKKGDNQPLYNKVMQVLSKASKLKPEDMVIYIGGSFGPGKGTTYMEIARVSDLLRGKNI